jgi:hypothetical protein
VNIDYAAVIDEPNEPSTFAAEMEHQSYEQELKGRTTMERSFFNQKLGLVNNFLTSGMTNSNYVSECLNKICAINEVLRTVGYLFGEEVQVL